MKRRYIVTSNSGNENGSSLSLSSRQREASGHGRGTSVNGDARGARDGAGSAEGIRCNQFNE